MERAGGGDRVVEPVLGRNLDTSGPHEGPRNLDTGEPHEGPRKLDTSGPQVLET